MLVRVSQTFLLVAALAVSAPRLQAGPAQETALETLGEEGEGAEDIELDVERELYIKNIVHTATKSVTTVQESPSVIYVITAEDIDLRGYRNYQMVLNDVPGILESNSQYDQFPNWTIRGVTQGVLLLKDGLSLFDPVVNTLGVLRRQPLENIKRIEIMTNPGGVLWGANSYLGIANFVTKDAEDVNGLEMAVGGGTGPGDEDVVRPYVMYGKVFFGGRLKVFAHWSVEWFRGPRYHMPVIYLYSPPPRVNGPTLFAPAQDSLTPFTFFTQFDGKLTWTKPGTARSVQLAWQGTFDRFPGLWSGIHRPLGFTGVVVRNDWPVKALREDNINWHESYVMLTYRDRFLSGALGLTTRAYYLNVERSFDPAVILAPSSILPGLGFDTTAVGHRAGWSLDMDWLVHRTTRLLWGGEVFYEWIKDSNVNFVAPLDENGQLNFGRLSVVCPFVDRTGDGIPVYDPTNPQNTTYLPGCKQPFIFDSDRLVAAGYLAAEVRPHHSLVFTGGLRLQAAPVGNAGYDPVLLWSLAGSWNFWKGLYIKTNFSTGFRAPVFINTSANGAVIDYAGNPNLNVEKSQAVQTEFFARIAQDKKWIREWTARINYSHTVLTDIIRILNGYYQNSPTRTVHAVEARTTLYTTQGHQFLASYTFLHQEAAGAADGGIIRAVPNHWFTLTSVFNLFSRRWGRLDVNTSLRVIGPFENPNRVPDASGTAKASDLAYDRIGPQALWRLGGRLRIFLGGRPLDLSLNFYNLLDARPWSIDVFSESGSRNEYLPTPGQRFYFFAQARYRL